MRREAMKRLVALAAATEVVTGLALIANPSLVSRLLFGGPMTGPGNALGPLAGFGLLCLAVASWPASEASARRGRLAMLLFSVLCAAYLVLRGAGGGAAGPLLWPAAALHALLGALLALFGRQQRVSPTRT